MYPVARSRPVNTGTTRVGRHQVEVLVAGAVKVGVVDDGQLDEHLRLAGGEDQRGVVEPVVVAPDGGAVNGLEVHADRDCGGTVQVEPEHDVPELLSLDGSNALVPAALGAGEGRHRQAGDRVVLQDGDRGGPVVRVKPVAARLLLEGVNYGLVALVDVVVDDRDLITVACVPARQRQGIHPVVVGPWGGGAGVAERHVEWLLRCRLGFDADEDRSLAVFRYRCI